jgi:hypothetical protein
MSMFHSVRGVPRAKMERFAGVSRSDAAIYLCRTPVNF